MVKKRIALFSMFVLIILAAVSVSGVEVSVSDYDPKPAEAGDALNVWFKIDNDADTPVNDLYIEVKPKDSLRLTAGEDSKKKVGVIRPKDAVTKEFRFVVKDDAFKGSHNLEVILTWGSTSVRADLSIEVTDKDLKDVSLSVGDIESDPIRIKPDDADVKLEVTVQNLGDGNAKGVKAELTGLPEGITLSESYSGTSLLGNIDADSTSTATFYIDVAESMRSGEYTSQLKTSYKYKTDEDEDDYIFETKEIPVTISIKPIPQYEIIATEFNPPVLTVGDKSVLLTITVKNTGEKAGESVRIKAYGKTEQPIKFEDASDFIAPIMEPGETGQATLEFNIEDDANLQTYYLDLEIKNVVNDDVLTYDKKVAVTVTNPRPDNPWWLVGIGVALIFVLLVFLQVKHMRHNNSAAPSKPLKTEEDYGKSPLKKAKR